MSDLTTPKIFQYRITLFYGPERGESDSDVLYCVFNVKRRSWKGGVQVVVEMTQTQVSRLRDLLDVDQWLQTSLAHLQEPEQEDYLERGQYLFIQHICLIKLQLAIGVGLHQENSRIPKDFLVTELDEAVEKDLSSVREGVLQELDIERTP